MALKRVDAAVLYAVAVEGREITAALSAKRFLGRGIAVGRAFGLRVAAVETGMGKTNAAAAAAAVIHLYRPRLVINMGIAGAYASSGLKRGDVAAAVMEVYADEGIAGTNDFVGLKEIGIPIYKSGRKDYFNEFPLDEKLTARALKILGQDSAAPARPPLAGTFATVSAVSGTPARARQIELRTGAVCENMEGASVVHVCTMYSTPALEIRGISNYAGLRDKNGWDIDAAVNNSGRAVIILLKNMSLIL